VAGNRNRLRLSIRGTGAVALILASLSFSCDNSFSPKAPFKEQIVVFAVLDRSVDVQIVRVESSYDADPGFRDSTAGSRPIETASVTVKGPSLHAVFSDTIVTMPDGRTQRMWKYRNFDLRYNSRYVLEVEVPGFDKLSSEMTVPGKLFVRARVVSPDTGAAVLRVGPGVETLEVYPAGYYYRVWVSVTGDLNGQAVERRMEVPSRFVPGRNEVEYTIPSRERTQDFPLHAVKYIHDVLTEGDTTVINKKLLVKAYTMETNFYSYYKVSRGFDDPVSVRIDRPDISFVDGGLGVFGAVVPDSMSYNYHTLIK